jgi:hypothetical protein
MHQAQDPSTGETAYRYLLPKGWNATDHITWDLKNKIRPLNYNSTLTSGDGSMSISMLPSETEIFQVQDGKVSGTLPPETATKALDTVLAATNPDLKNANLIIRKDFDVPTPLENQGLKTKGMVGILEVSFQKDGHQVTELLSATEYEGSHQGDGGLVQGVWMMAAGYTMTCTGSMTEDAFKLFASVVASQRPDPIFYETMMEVSTQQQSGAVDLQAVAKNVKGLSPDAKTSYLQNLLLHSQSIAKIFPIYPGQTEVATLDGSMLSYKGLHVWMRKPNEYLVTDSADSPGNGWQPAKEAS